MTASFHRACIISCLNAGMNSVSGRWSAWAGLRGINRGGGAHPVHSRTAQLTIRSNGLMNHFFTGPRLNFHRQETTVNKPVDGGVNLVAFAGFNPGSYDCDVHLRLLVLEVIHCKPDPVFHRWIEIDVGLDADVVDRIAGKPHRSPGRHHQFVVFAPETEDA